MAEQASVGVAEAPEARKPKLVLAPAATAPLYPAFVAWTVFPLVARVAFQACWTGGVPG